MFSRLTSLDKLPSGSQLLCAVLYLQSWSTILLLAIIVRGCASYPKATQITLMRFKCNKTMPTIHRKAFALLVAGLAVFSFQAVRTSAQSQGNILSMTLGPNQIGILRTAPEITTRISFPDVVKEIVCGDLYDSASGKGSFVVQRSDKDVFLKPIVPKGLSNLFVKTGEKGEHVYNFDLQIVGESQAYRVVNISGTGPNQSGPTPTQDDDDSKAADNKAADIIARAHQQGERILAEARQQATEIKQQAEAQASSASQKASEDAVREVEHRFARLVMAGIDELKVKDEHIGSKKIIVKVDRRILKFGDKAYLRYTIQNASDAPFSYSGIEIQKDSGKGPKPLTVEFTQNKEENTLKVGEVITGVITMDPKALAPPGTVEMVIKQQGNKEFARLQIAVTS